MATAAQRRLARLRLLALFGLLLLMAGSLYVSRYTHERGSRETLSTKPPFTRGYVPVRSDDPGCVTIRYALSQNSSLIVAPRTRALIFETGARVRVPELFRYATYPVAADPAEASVLRFITSPTGEPGPANDPSTYPNMRSTTWLFSSFCRPGASHESGTVCHSGKLASLKNGVILFMAPHRCDDPSLALAINQYASTLERQENGGFPQPPTEFSPPHFTVSDGEVRTLRFLFHVLPALDRHVLFYHPYPVHVMCRGEPSSAYRRVLRDTLRNAAYVTVENVQAALNETVTDTANRLVRTTFKDQYRAALSARLISLGLEVVRAESASQATTTTTTTGPGEHRDGGSDPVTTATDDATEQFLIQSAQDWVEAWEVRRFWAYQIWFLPSLAEYDVFWRLDATSSLFTKPFEEDVFDDLMLRSCAFGFRDIGYTSHRRTRGVFTILGGWNSTLEKTLHSDLPASALRAAWSWLTDDSGTFTGKHFTQDFFVGAFSTFQHPLMKSFWLTVENPLFFDAYKMRWDDGIAQSIVAQTTAEAERWNVCHFAGIPGYRLV